MNQAVEHEVGPITRAEIAEAKVEEQQEYIDLLVKSGKINLAENETLKLLLLNLTTATCPIVRCGDASEALREAHKEAAGALGLECKRLLTSYLSED